MQTAHSDAEREAGPVVLEAEHVAKRFVIRKDNSLKERIVTLGTAGRRHREEFWALKDVSMKIHAGHTVGLIGHNGSGKSTLLKVIGGIIEPTTGSVSRRGRVAALLELGAGFHPDLTGRENVFLNASVLGLSREETESRFDDIVAFSGVGEFIDTQVKFYSSGMYVRLAFAVAVHTDPDLLLVDEVLAVGDEAFQRKCLDKIKTFQEEGRTIILVTHSLSQVAEFCDRAILLNQGEVVVEGDPRTAIAAFRDLLEDRRQEEIKAAPVAQPRLDGRVLGATATAEGRAPVEPARPGDDIIIESRFSHPSGLDGWVCAIQIDNVHGQKVYGSTTRETNTHLEPLVGERTVTMRVKNAMFGAGKYFVNVSLMDMAGRHLYDMPQAVSFNVVSDDESSGSLYAISTFEERPGAAGAR